MEHSEQRSGATAASSSFSMYDSEALVPHVHVRVAVEILSKRVSDTLNFLKQARSEMSRQTNNCKVRQLPLCAVSHAQVQRFIVTAQTSCREDRTT